MNVIVGQVVYGYLAVDVAKSLLALADVHVAAGTTHRFNGRPVWLLILGVAFGVVATSLLIWPRALAVEGWRFFLTYSRFNVIRQVVNGYREADIHHTGAMPSPKGNPHAHK